MFLERRIQRRTICHIVFANNCLLSFTCILPWWFREFQLSLYIDDKKNIIESHIYSVLLRSSYHAVVIKWSIFNKSTLVEIYYRFNFKIFDNIILILVFRNIEIISFESVIKIMLQIYNVPNTLFCLTIYVQLKWQLSMNK